MNDLKRLLSLCAPHLAWMSLGVFLTLITLFANITLLTVSGWFLAAMAVAGLSASSMNYFTPAGIIRFLALSRTAGRYGERLITHEATLRVLGELRVWFFRCLLPLAPAALQQHRSDDIFQRIQHDIDALDHFYLRFLLPVLCALAGVPLVLWAIAHWQPNLAIVDLFGLLAVGLLIPALAFWKSRPLGPQHVRESTLLRHQLIESVQGLGELLVYQAAATQRTKTLQLSQQLNRTQLKQQRIAHASMAASHLCIQLTLWGSLWVLIPLLANGAISAPIGALLSMLILVSFETVTLLPAAIERMPQIMASARRLFSLIDQSPVRPEPPTPAVPKQFDVHFESVDLRYEARGPLALREFTLSVSDKEHVAILGPSGAGKSSLANLLTGFWPPSAGSVHLGGLDVSQISGDTLRQHVVLLSQKPYLFAGSIADNLRLAQPEASDETLYDACRQAGIHDTLANLPQGYQTWLGESGLGLSGGQAQRLSIAQAILKDAPIWILDEPTEGLDPATERAVCKALLPLMADKTVLLITHRPILLAAVDRVVVMTHGRVDYLGSHTTLLAERPEYQALMRHF